MLEKEPSGASPDRNQPPQLAGAAPGGPFPQGHPSVIAVVNPPDSSRQYTLQFLIAAIKKSNSDRASTNTGKAQ
jgi:hypothetical protein